MALSIALAVAACGKVDLGDWDLGLGSIDVAPETGPVPGSPLIANYVTTATVALRDGPSSGIRIRRVLPADTVVRADGRELDGWWEVQYRDGIGWIYAAYLRPE